MHQGFYSPKAGFQRETVSSFHMAAVAQQITIWIFFVLLLECRGSVRQRPSCCCSERALTRGLAQSWSWPCQGDVPEVHQAMGAVEVAVASSASL